MKKSQNLHLTRVCMKVAWSTLSENKQKLLNMDIVKEVLKKQAKEAEKFKTIQVAKHEDVKIDLGSMLISDSNAFDESELK
jgi:hypothetical protein